MFVECLQGRVEEVLAEFYAFAGQNDTFRVKQVDDVGESDTE
jgi:hypothetical protein